MSITGDNPQGAGEGMNMTESYDKRTWEAVEELRHDIGSLKSTVDTYIAGQHQVCEFRKHEIQTVQETINGNGKRGIKQQVDWLVGREHHRQRVLAAVLTFLAANVGSVIFALRVLARATVLLKSVEASGGMP